MNIEPSKAEFLKLARLGNLIPVTRRVLADFETPLSAYQKIRGRGESFLCESVEGGERIGRYSFVGCNPRAVLRQLGDRVELVENGRVVERFSLSAQAGGAAREDHERSEEQSHVEMSRLHRVSPNREGVGESRGGDGRMPPKSDPGADGPVPPARDGLAVLEEVMGRFHAVPRPGLPRFTGGAVGFIGYEFIHDIEPVVPRPPRDDLGTPVLCFLIADQILVFDHVAQTITVLVNAVLDGARGAEEAYEEAVGEIERLVSLLEQPSAHIAADVPAEVPQIPVVSNVTREAFEANVLRAKKYITGGDIIQVVGSQRFSTPVHAAPLDIYRAARSINPSPYMFLLELEGFSLVGASPETHVRCEEGRVELRPIAGTRPRGTTEAEDAALATELLADPKERAEHVMLVDLARNDLGRVCEYGSVVVRDLMIIERYSHVMHIVSQVEGKLAAGRTPYDLMRATFPAGTLSGAPKIRAMQIIAELERTARGPYGGCMGYFSFSGNLDCCITIRTALLKNGFAYVQAGGGWVNDSTPEGEYQETVNKAKAMLKAVALAETFGGGGTCF
ncbi:MAG: chorismate-binding protein [Verrucomicrobiota bacterium]